MKKFGTTIIEISLYFAIVAGILLSLMTFAIQIYNVHGLSDNLHQLQSNLNFISEKMTSTIQNATSININDSIFDQNEGVLSLNVSNPSLSPTNFYINNGNIFMTQNNNQEIQLNSNSIKFIFLRFHRITYPKAPDQIIIDATLRPGSTELASINKNLSLNLSISLRNL